MARFVIPNARISFPHVFSKGTFEGKPSDKYECTLLIDKEDEATLALIKLETKKILLAEFQKIEKIPKGITKGTRYCLRDGDDAEYDGYAGCMSFKSANKAQPKLMGRDKNIITEDSGLLYAGSYADAVVGLWVQDNQYGKGVRANLFALRHRSDGEPFGQGGIPANVEDDFEDLDAEELSAGDLDEYEI